ncbi:hypothetical protein ACKWTF_006734 [Chironomus riparius]
MGLSSGFLIFAGILLLNSDFTNAQTRRNQSPRAGPTGRALGLNPKGTSSSSSEFQCPEEFGYFPHPSDCSLYYVCVFGGALQESCTGGLMYSHELQTCDWPRNVGCEASEVSKPAPAPAREVTPRVPQVSSRVRFSSLNVEQTAPSGPSGPSGPSAPSAPAHIQQIQTLPPPPNQQRISPKPVITSRGQPPSFTQDEILKQLYEETHDTLPPAEEEETDRNQRVYRGQPSTVTQVQRDRDGIIHQPSHNAIPTQNKVGSFSFTNSQIPTFTRVEQSSPAPSAFNIPSKTQITQNKNYYNTSNYNTNFDPFYPSYDDGVDIYSDVDYSNIYNQPKSTPSSTYRPTTTQSPQTFATRPQTQSTTYLTQTQAPPKQKYNQQNIYSSADYDDGLNAQLEESERYGQQEEDSSNFRGDRNELSPTFDRKLPKVQSPSSFSNGQKYSSVPAIVKLSTPEPFSYKPTVPVTQRYSTSRSYSSTKFPQTFPTTSSSTTTTTQRTTTTQEPPQYYPTRPSNRNPSRGSSAYAGETQSTVSQNSGRGTSPTRARPTLKPAQIVTKDAQQFVDIYRHQPTRIEPLYPQPVPDKTAAKCRKDVCLLPDCYCGGKDIPGKLPLDETPQLVLITFEDSVNDVHNKVFEMLFNSSRKNPNGCEIRATFFISHEWTDYGLVQDLYADGHEIASHSVSHSFGEQFSLKKWAREIAGQREILSAYGGVKQDDIRGMRAPFLSIGGNKMFKMLYDFNFTYDSSMPVYENRPPSWPYTLDYKLFHDCMIPPCPTKSYPGVWEVPMVMWQDLNGGRCSMGDACSNPAESEGVYKMIMKNFERHYTTNRAPFGLFYHAAWFTQPHHKEGFIQFLDAINSMKDVYIVTNWQALQWVRDPTPISRMQSFQPFQCNYQDRPKRCNNPKVCNLWHKSGVRYMRTCQPCPEIYPWTGKTGIRSSRIDNDLEVVEST